MTGQEPAFTFEVRDSGKQTRIYEKYISRPKGNESTKKDTRIEL